MKVVGKTEEGKLVVNGVFKMKDTYGFPLEMALDLLDKKGMVVDWLAFWEEGIQAGWKPERILMTIEASIGDVFGGKYREEFMRRMKYCLMNQERT